MLKLVCSAAFLLSFCIHAKAQGSVIEDIDPSAPVMTFETETIDFGNLNQGDEAIREFKFKNTGKSPLIIKDVKGQCGCTTIPDGWSKAPIKPGASSSIKVKYDTAHSGSFDKKVTITSNANLAVKDVNIKGFVKPQGASPGGGK